MLNLHDVTLVMIETREHELANLAVRDSVAKVRFGEVLIFTDRPEMFDHYEARIVKVPDWPTKLGWSRCFWYDVAPQVGTSHTLGVQWDSWCVDPGMWNDEFLKYDYCGSPWWHRDGMNVGNGGFCLRSTSLLRFIRKNRAQFPCITDLDDDLYCRKYRPTLEAAGFEWAPEALAQDFAFECVRPDPNARHFGFHAAYNFDYGCGGDEQRLLERARIMLRSGYATRTNKYIWDGFAKKCPHIVEQVMKEVASGRAHS